MRIFYTSKLTSLNRPYLIEACVESVPDAVTAEKKGADQIELCADLDKDGLTPSFTLIKQTTSILRIPVKVIIRPRAGNFVYNSNEVQQMIRSINICRYIGVDGVVFGALTQNETHLDLEILTKLAETAYPLNITIHKAIDQCTNPLREIQRLKGIKNIQFILSYGKEATAQKGSTLLQKMIKQGGDRFTTIPAGKITKDNLGQLHSLLGANIYHGSAIV